MLLERVRSLDAGLLQEHVHSLHRQNASPSYHRWQGKGPGARPYLYLADFGGLTSVSGQGPRGCAPSV
jgi:hypothetical protein